MKLYILGSCSGTEPFEGRHHTSVALDVEGRVYLFDAGECCSHTAHLLGIDLLSVSDIFISHPHMDHVGGLGNLLWCIKKLSRVKKQLPRFGDVNVYISNQRTFDGVLSVLGETEENYKSDYKTLYKKVTDSTLLTNESIEVTAKHNHHLKPTAEGWQSFSFRICAEGKTLIYSGDVKTLSDMEEFLTDGCDVLLMETGHHAPEDVCREIVDGGYRVGSLIFMHHGRRILYDYEGELEKCRRVIPGVIISNDGDVFDI